MRLLLDGMSDAKPDKSALRWGKIEEFLKTHDHIMNADVRALWGVLAATANRILAGLAAEGKLAKQRKGGHWMYQHFMNNFDNCRFSKEYLNYWSFSFPRYLAALI